MNQLDSDLRNAVREIPDFPRPGIMFKDITPVLQDGGLFNQTVDAMAGKLKSVGPSQIVAVESRGFIFGAPLAYALGCGLVIVRKPNKLPHQKASLEYALEYGSDQLEIHVDALTKSDRVVIVDDLLATGGTARATAGLVEKLGAQVELIAFFSELSFLNGRKNLAPYEVYSLVEY